MQMYFAAVSEWLWCHTELDFWIFGNIRSLCWCADEKDCNLKKELGDENRLLVLETINEKEITVLKLSHNTLTSHPCVGTVNIFKCKSNNGSMEWTRNEVEKPRTRDIFGEEYIWAKADLSATSWISKGFPLRDELLTLWVQRCEMSWKCITVIQLKPLSAVTYFHL